MPQTKAICICAVSFRQGQVEECSLTFENKEEPHTIRAHCTDQPHQCFCAALQLPTGVGLPEGGRLLLRHDLRLGARRSRARCVQRQLAHRQLTL